MGFGFRCGFLGMLHMEIVQERLEREYDLDLITTAPTVIYEVMDSKGKVSHVDNPASLPPINQIDEIREPLLLPIYWCRRIISVQWWVCVLKSAVCS